MQSHNEIVDSSTRRIPQIKKERSALRFLNGDRRSSACGHTAAGAIGYAAIVAWSGDES